MRIHRTVENPWENGKMAGDVVGVSFMKNKFKVLVVEDELPVAMMMVHLLTRAGCDVEMAPTGRRGL